MSSCCDKVTSFFSKCKYTYNTQADLQDLTAEQIVRLNPCEVSTTIDKDTGGVPLNGVKRRALNRLLAIKEIPEMSESQRQKAINNFLSNENSEQVKQVIRKAEDDIVNETSHNMMQQATQTNLENRLRALKNLPPKPMTWEEEMAERMRKLKYTGGVSRRRRRTKRRKCRSTRSRHNRRSRRTRTYRTHRFK